MLNIPRATKPKNPTVDQLNVLLSSYAVLRQTVHGFHWTIEGPLFFELHNHFGTLYEDIVDRMDILAEQIRILDDFPLVKMSEFLQNSLIEEADKTTIDREIISLVKQGYQTIISYMTQMFNQGLDPGTENIIQTFIQDEGKKVWMLRVFNK